MESSFRAYVEAVKGRAHGRWPAVLAALGIPAEALVNRHQPCPMCGGTDRFRFDDRHGNGDYYCNGCGAGDGFTLLEKQLGWDFAEAVRRVGEAVGVVLPAPGARREEAPRSRLRALLQRIWEQAKPVQAGDEVARYLANRGLELPAYPRALRTHPSLGYFERTGSRSRRVGAYAAMLAKVQAVDRHPVTLHRTYLEAGAKAPVEGVKKLFSAGVRGAAIRLYEPEGELALAEGIETALAVHRRLGLPVWAAGNAGALEVVAVPATVTAVRIFADCDANFRGQAAAYRLAHRLATIRRGLEVSVYVPRETGKDFLDVYYARRRVAA
jgi:putative DNA primase/helicase